MLVPNPFRLEECDRFFLLAKAVAALDLGMLVLDGHAAQLSVVYANAAGERLTGIAAGTQASFFSWPPLAGNEAKLQTVRDAVHGGYSCRIELECAAMHDANGAAPHWLELQLQPLRDAAGQATHYAVVLRDTTDVRESIARLTHSEAQFHTIMLSVQEGIQLWDAQGARVFANPAAEGLFAGHVDALSGRPDSAGTLAFFGANGMPILPADFPVQQVLRSGTAVNDTLMRISCGGDVSEDRWLRVNAYPIRDEADTLAGVVTSATEVTELFLQERRLEQLAHYDALTQLPNRVLLSDRMQQAIAQCRRSGGTLAVCLLDLDGFKPVNDTYGHKAGDQLLREVGHRLRETVREGDTAARLGGDEFALLLVNLKSFSECEQILQRVLATVAAPYTVAGETVRVSASIGVTLFPNDGGEPDKLLRHADQAMYKAKQAGKNCHQFFDPSHDQRRRANRGALRKIEEALSTYQFEMHFQPLVDCRQGRVVGAEALVRWKHPVLGLLSPAEFLPLIEDDDLIVDLGEWTLREGLRWLAKAGALGRRDLQVSVNVSARHLHRQDFVDRLQAIFADEKPELAHHLKLEIVETAALEDINTVGDLIAAGHVLGTEFALDDFGTGFSSLIHLKRLAIDALKIDRTFIVDMLEDPADLAIVEGIIGLAAAFRSQVVAEGVESIDQILMLLELGCDVMQGYALARPMPEDKFFEWLGGFEPDPRWRLASTPRPMRRDFQLLLAEANMRHWVDRLLAHARGEGAAPPMDHRECRFGSWYFDSGLQSYGTEPQFRAIDMRHRALHRLGVSLLEQVAQGNAAAKSQLADELELARDELMAEIRDFRSKRGETTLRDEMRRAAMTEGV